MSKKAEKKQDEPVVVGERIDADVIKFRLADGADPNVAVGELHSSFGRWCKEGIRQFVFDMGNVTHPNGSFIAMLIGATHKARRLGGDLKIINLSETAQNHFSMFTPLTYLSIGLDEISSIEDVSRVSPSLVEEFANFEEGKPTTLRVAAVVDSLNNVTHFVETLAKRAGMEQLELSKLKIAVYEACMNVIEHAYRFEPGHSMEVEVLLRDSRFEISIIDHGGAFDFYGVEPYDVHEAYHERREGGFGLYIIQKSVDEVTYESDPSGGNRLTLVKKLP